jgi:hypothetical protein
MLLQVGPSCQAVAHFLTERGESEGSPAQVGGVPDADRVTRTCDVAGVGCRERLYKPAVTWMDLTMENQMPAEERETGTLIGSDKIEGTAVFGPDAMRIGSIRRVMIDKRSGKVSYAVLSFGGFLGVGDDYYPLPWHSLKYDTDLGGYRARITEKHLESAPKYSDINDWNWDDDTRLQGVSSHYGVVPT